MKSNITKHPCSGKCTEFKEEQCKTCLVQEVSFCDADFLVGDVVVSVEGSMDQLLTVTKINQHPLNSKANMVGYEGGGYFGWVHEFELRLATTAELQANRRLTKVEQALAEVL